MDPMDPMDPRERQPDEARLRQREESLGRRAGDALNEMDARNAAQCPDGEILAAYAERALSQPEAEKWESHFATCARCRQILLALSASADTPLAVREVAPAGERVPAARAPVEITRGSATPRRAKSADWRVRWLAPALGVAAVLAVWFAMRPPWRATDRGSENLIAQAPKTEITPPSAVKENRVPSATPPPEQKQDRSAALTRRAQPSAKAPAEAFSGEPMAKLGTNRDESDANSLEKKKELDRLADKAQFQSAPAPAPAAPPPPPAAAVAPQSAANQPAAAAGPAQAEAKSNADANATLQANPARRQSALALARPAQKVSSVVLQSPFGSEAWRVGSGGRIEHSPDGGETWNPQTSPSQQDWLAGVAVSDVICWIAGRNGAIARTTDGEHWELIATPPQAAAPGGVPPDWVAITARDAQRATVTATDGRKFATLDGGKTWGGAGL